MRNRHVAVLALIFMTSFAVYVEAQPILPSTSEKYSVLAVLGPTQKIGNYPTNLIENQSFQLYGYVANHQGSVQYFNVVVKIGNQNTVVTNNTFAQATILKVYSHILLNNQSWTFPLTLSVNRTGSNLRIIFELWSYNVSLSSFEYTGLYNVLNVNVTAS